MTINIRTWKLFFNFIQMRLRKLNGFLKNDLNLPAYLCRSLKIFRILYLDFNSSHVRGKIMNLELMQKLLKLFSEMFNPTFPSPKYRKIVSDPSEKSHL